MNPQQLQDRLRAIGASYNSPLTLAKDYANGIAYGAGGQQLANMVFDGADPNPLVSGMLAGPAYRAARQVGRLSAMKTSKAVMFENLDPTDYEAVAANGQEVLSMYGANAPIASTLGLASQIASVGGAGTSAYNSIFGGDDIDNNIPSAAIGGMALAALAPLTFRRMQELSRAKASQKASQQPTANFNTIALGQSL